MSLTSTGLAVRKVAGRIGAEIGGVTLSGDLDDAVVAEIRDAILTHKVVFVRGQHHLDEDGQAAFARRLGPLTAAHPTVPAWEGSEYVLDLASEKTGGGRANNWHTDVTFVDRPPSFSVLRSVVIPEFGGDTVWANTAAAYAGLPEPLRNLVDGLWVSHTNEYDYARMGAALIDEQDTVRAAYAAVFQSVGFETLHPLVRVHPETGERSLLLGGFAKHVDGFTKADSLALITLLQNHITTLENSVRWSWQVGDVVIWDNRATQHYAVADYGTLPRTVRRITVVGEVPVSIDGRPSQARKGDSSQYNFATAD